MSRDRETYGSVRARYDEWLELVKSKPAPPAQERALPPQQAYTPQPERDQMSKTVFAVIGFAIGAFLLLMAAWAFTVSAKWNGLDRMGAATGYLLIGSFLTISGAGGIIATWNHNFRVLARRGTSRSH